MYKSEEFKPKETKFEEFRNSENFSKFLDGITLSVVGILIIVIGMLYFTQVGANMGMSLLEVGYECAILYGATVAIYLLLRGLARRKGKATKAYIDAFMQVEKNSDRIVRENIANRTTEYCRDWERRELESAREHILADVGIKLEEFNEKYLKYSIREIKEKYTDLTEEELKTVCRAKRIKALHFDENYLSVYNKNGRRKSPSQFLSTEALEKMTIVRMLITTAITSLFGVTLVLQLVSDFNLATVVMCLAKIMIILMSAVIGMWGGYNMTAVKAVDEMKAKTKWQDRFMKWCGVELEKKEEK